MGRLVDGLVDGVTDGVGGLTDGLGVDLELLNQAVLSLNVRTASVGLGNLRVLNASATVGVTGGNGADGNGGSGTGGGDNGGTGGGGNSGGGANGGASGSDGLGGNGDDTNSGDMSNPGAQVSGAGLGAGAIWAIVLGSLLGHCTGQPFGPGFAGLAAVVLPGGAQAAQE